MLPRKLRSVVLGDTVKTKIRHDSGSYFGVPQRFLVPKSPPAGLLVLVGKYTQSPRIDLLGLAGKKG